MDDEEQHREPKGRPEHGYPRFGESLNFETHEMVRCQRCGELRFCDPEFGRNEAHIEPCRCVEGPVWLDATLICWGEHDSGDRG